ncbi:hypothetical protein [Ahrensia sp. R2A130]|uniref:hypothetical protein n=1 Tax=Ahrensia sp. R2A130 TaxID=744979 RepID=UPI0001E0A47B|nr:hypothetical protein [Ahrensia sp. R2A130]EFL89669.1 conserved hypothetical protein [Ahrensia sp. R2A130]
MSRHSFCTGHVSVALAAFASATILGSGFAVAQDATAPTLKHDIKALLGKLTEGREKPVELKMRPLPMQGAEKPGQHDCFWMGPVYSGAFNVAYPDEGAVYWPLTITIPDLDKGAFVEIAGRFPQARYMSLNSYDKKSAPYHVVTDRDITPDAGSQNPFAEPTIEGEGDRSYTLRILGGKVPSEPAANTLYLGPADDVNRSPILLRHYIPETPGDESGGAGLPKVTLVKADGTRVSGEAACAALSTPALDDPARTIFAPVVDKEQFDELLKKPSVAKNYLDTKKEEWRVFWDPRLSILSLISPPLQEVAYTAARVGLIPKSSGFFANIDNQYVSLNLNDKFGEVVVLEAEMPRTPTIGRMAGSGEPYDLRYWSLCSNESLVTTRFSDCVYDAEIPLDEKRRYKIVISKAANRPANANGDCGIAWLDWGDAGDGAGNTGLTTLLLRNMLPSEGFTQSVQAIPGPGLEAKSMGKYLPAPQYMTKAQFEAKGC